MMMSDENDDEYHYNDDYLRKKEVENMNDYEKMFKEFGITGVRRRIAYCNNNVIPLLKKRKIEWDMNIMRIKFCKRTFPMKYIENGEAEEFINSLIDKEGQTKLTLYK